MSRLDSFIRRMVAQRECLDMAAREIADLPGVVLELGLGNGRTYDHLRELMPGREIFVFDRQVNAHPDCVPDAGHLYVGEVVEQLPQATRRLGRTVALVHMDIGSGRADIDAAQGRRVVALLAPLLLPGALILSDQKLPVDTWHTVPLPAGVPEQRYFIYRAAA